MGYGMGGTIVMLGRNTKDRIINLYFFDPWIIPGSHPGRIVTKARRRREVNGWTEIDAIRCIRNTHPAMLLAIVLMDRHVTLIYHARPRLVDNLINYLYKSINCSSSGG